MMRGDGMAAAAVATTSKVTIDEASQ